MDPSGNLMKAMGPHAIKIHKLNGKVTCSEHVNTLNTIHGPQNKSSSSNAAKVFMSRHLVKSSLKNLNKYRSLSSHFSIVLLFPVSQACATFTHLSRSDTK